ncbi:hypothetical protein EDC04DRAFT_871842 [Pisolithus marmoratus]|nr:hypothetical protein EDC04DRAFT_871842 [Pisolithus marmoratus]
MLHKDTLSNYRKEFRQEMRECLPNLTPEEAFKLVKSKRDDFMAQSYDWKYPFVLRHGDLHGRNVIVSRSSPRRILAIIDWDFGGSHALPFADRDFEVSSPCLSEKTDIRAEQAQEMYDAQLLIDELAGALPRDDQLSKLVVSMRLCVLNQEGTKKRHSTFRMFRNVVRDILAPIVGVLKCKACICN